MKNDFASEISKTGETGVGDLAEIRAWSHGQKPRDYAQICVVEQIEEQVRRCPEAIALRCGSEEVTYAELDMRANRLARYLRRRHGVTRGRCVGICLARSIDAIVAILGVLKAGGVFVPLDGTVPVERLKPVVEECECAVVLAEKGQDFPLGVPVDGTMPSRDETEEGSRLERAVEASAVAYILYTSGSTGRPKGVVVEHRQLSSYVTWAVESYLAENMRGFAICTSLTFDLTITSIFCPLVSGRTGIIIADGWERAGLGGVIGAPGVHVVKLTPSHLQLLSEKDAGESEVRAVILGGEQLTTVAAQRLHDALGGRAAIYNEYGPTEATVGCMIERYDPARGGAVVPIGRPMAGAQIWVLDAKRRICAPLASGEIYIAGCGIARGYLNRPEETAERFIPHPLTGETGNVYRTGDLARWMPDGHLEYLGRNDDQVKIRGHRIELGEVEVALGGLKGISGAAVTTKQGELDDTELVGFFVTSLNLSSEQVIQALRARVPLQMVPSLLIKVDRLPLAPSGKIDRDALKMMALTGGAPRSVVIAADDTLREIWQAVLSRQIEDGDDFFDVGGHSFAVVKVIGEIRKRLGWKVPIGTIYKNAKFGEFKSICLANCERWSTAKPPECATGS